jgi:hypothetical protein
MVPNCLGRGVLLDCRIVKGPFVFLMALWTCWASVVLAGAPEEVSLVRIEATGRVAEEDSAPLRRLQLVGEFTVSRSGSAEHSLPVWLHVSGTATSGVDYEGLPWLVNIPAGSNAVTVPVRAIQDNVPEGIETVVVEVSNCPPETHPPLGAPCYGFAIDAARARATVFIREDGLTMATVHVTRPAERARFPVGETIQIEAMAIHLESYISEVEFLADGVSIGTSTLYFFAAPPPGSPIVHQVEWSHAPVGDHVLTARAVLLDGTLVESSPVLISVGPGSGNDAPVVEIASPVDGAAFPTGAEVSVVVEARDPEGFVGLMELYADGLKIGEEAVAFFAEPPPNQLQSFEFTWADAMPGSHVLTARATDGGGRYGVSTPVEIVVGGSDTRPTLRVVARDAFAVEPTAAGGVVNTATFRVQRFGPVEGDVTVRYLMGGRATNGLDYAALSGGVVLVSGSAWVDVVVTPSADGEEEGLESVVLMLEQDAAYRLAHRRRAVAVISDRAMAPHGGGGHCRQLADGLVHFCFPAPSGALCRLEGSGNLREWTTLFTLPAVDGAVHYLMEVADDEDGPFCRVVDGD